MFFPTGELYICPLNSDEMNSKLVTTIHNIRFPLVFGFCSLCRFRSLYDSAYLRVFPSIRTMENCFGKRNFWITQDYYVRNVCVT